jgi:hypothetical protein
MGAGMKIIIGKHGERDLDINLDVLMETRLLIQANSGGGKSYLLRRLAEQAFGKLPVIIIDPEGEFASLREKFGFVLVGEGGETPADPRSAGLVGETLLKLQASAVCDLHEAFRKNPAGRQAWVKAFLESFIDAPKSLWRDTLIIIDEAQLFCPQDGNSACHDAMVSLNTVGRKRGFCPVWATQRLALIDKDASSQLLNRIVGMTFEDVDVRRAVSLLSVAPEEKREFERTIRTLQQGDFFAFGRAISKERILFHGGAVQTTHPKRGSQRTAVAPPTPEQVKALLPKLADLPKEVEKKAKTEADLRQEIAQLKSELSRKPIPQNDQSVIERAVGDAVRKRDAEWDRKKVQAKAVSLRALDSWLSELMAALMPEAMPVVQVPKALPVRAIVGIPFVRETRTTDSNGRLAKAERKILCVLAQYPQGRTKRQVALLTAYASSGGGFNNAISSLRSKGYMKGQDPLSATGDGLAILGSYDPLPTGQELREHWYRQLGKCETAILKWLVANYPQTTTKEEVAAGTGYEAGGGGFNNAVSRLRTLELIEGRGELKASEELF